jgi:hypothetical protein
LSAEEEQLGLAATGRELAQPVGELELIGIDRRPWRDLGAVSCPLTIARRT